MLLLSTLCLAAAFVASMTTPVDGQLLYFGGRINTKFTPPPTLPPNTGFRPIYVNTTKMFNFTRLNQSTIKTPIVKPPSTTFENFQTNLTDLGRVEKFTVQTRKDALGIITGLGLKEKLGSGAVSADVFPKTGTNPQDVKELLENIKGEKNKRDCDKVPIETIIENIDKDGAKSDGRLTECGRLNELQNVLKQKEFPSIFQKQTKLVQTSRSRYLTLELTFGPSKLSSIKNGSVTFTEVQTPGCTTDGEPGEPAIPIFSQFIFVPPDSKIVSITPTEGSQVDALLAPYQLDTLDTKDHTRFLDLTFKYNDTGEIKDSGRNTGIYATPGFVFAGPNYVKPTFSSRKACTLTPAKFTSRQFGAMLRCHALAFTPNPAKITLFSKLRIVVSTSSGNSRRQLNESKYSFTAPSAPCEGFKCDRQQLIRELRPVKLQPQKSAVEPIEKIRLLEETTLAKVRTETPFLNLGFLWEDRCNSQEMSNPLTRLYDFRRLFNDFGLSHNLPRLGTSSQYSYAASPWEVNKLAINGFDFPKWFPIPDIPGVECSVCRGEDLLIIVPAEFEEPAQRLAQHKRARGYATSVAVIPDVLELEWDDKSDWSKLGLTRQWIDFVIEARYLLCDLPPKYIILFGESDKIPNFPLSFPTDSGGTGYVGTDIFYSLMGSEVATHADFKAMQSNGGLPMYPDFELGRLSAQTLQQAWTIVNKTIQYERDPTAGAGTVVKRDKYFKNVMYAGYFELKSTTTWSGQAYGTSDRDYIKSVEEANSIISAKGYDDERIYCKEQDSPDYIPYYYKDGSVIPYAVRSVINDANDDETLNKERIRDGFSEGRFMVFQRDHGSIQSWSRPKLRVSDFNNYVNTTMAPTIMFNLNCLSGSFDNEMPWNAGGASVNSDSFAEQILRREGGVAAIVAATRVTFTSANNQFVSSLASSAFIGHPNPLTSTRRQTFFTISQIMNSAKANLASKGVSDSKIADQKAKYHVLGDPTLKIWTRPPLRIITDFIFKLKPFYRKPLTPDDILIQLKHNSSVLIPKCDDEEGCEINATRPIMIRNALKIQLPKLNASGSGNDDEEVVVAVYSNWKDEVDSMTKVSHTDLCRDAATPNPTVLQRFTIKPNSTGSITLGTPTFYTEQAQKQFVEGLKFVITSKDGDRDISSTVELNGKPVVKRHRRQVSLPKNTSLVKVKLNGKNVTSAKDLVSKLVLRLKLGALACSDGLQCRNASYWSDNLPNLNENGVPITLAQPLCDRYYGREGQYCQEDRANGKFDRCCLRMCGQCPSPPPPGRVAGGVYERKSDGSIGDRIGCARIKFVSEDGSVTIQARSNTSSGMYVMDPVDPARYTVTASAYGYEPYDSSPGFAVVNSGTAHTVNIFLKKRSSNTQQDGSSQGGEFCRVSQSTRFVKSKSVEEIKKSLTPSLKDFTAEDIQQNMLAIEEYKKQVQERLNKRKCEKSACMVSKSCSKESQFTLRTAVEHDEMLVEEVDQVLDGYVEAVATTEALVADGGVTLSPSTTSPTAVENLISVVTKESYPVGSIVYRLTFNTDFDNINTTTFGKAVYTMITSAPFNISPSAILGIELSRGSVVAAVVLAEGTTTPEGVTSGSINYNNVTLESSSARFCAEGSTCGVETEETSGSSSDSSGWMVATFVGCAILLLVIVGLIVVIVRRNQRQAEKSPPRPPIENAAYEMDAPGRNSSTQKATESSNVTVEATTKIDKTDDNDYAVPVDEQLPELPTKGLKRVDSLC